MLPVFETKKRIKLLIIGFIIWILIGIFIPKIYETTLKWMLGWVIMYVVIINVMNLAIVAGREHSKKKQEKL